MLSSCPFHHDFDTRCLSLCIRPSGIYLNSDLKKFHLALRVVSPSLLRLGQILRGKLGKYEITTGSRDGPARKVSLQTSEITDLYKNLLTFNRDQTEQIVVKKGAQGHPHIRSSMAQHMNASS